MCLFACARRNDCGCLYEHVEALADMFSSARANSSSTRPTFTIICARAYPFVPSNHCDCKYGSRAGTPGWIRYHHWCSVCVNSNLGWVHEFQLNIIFALVENAPPGQWPSHSVESTDRHLYSQNEFHLSTIFSSSTAITTFRRIIIITQYLLSGFSFGASKVCEGKCQVLSSTCKSGFEFHLQVIVCRGDCCNDVDERTARKKRRFGTVTSPALAEQWLLTNYLLSSPVSE